MKIKRTIYPNGEMEFELTADELRDAFYEQQEIYDRDDMMYYLEETRDVLLCNGYTKDFVDGLSEHLEEMGVELRRQIDKYDVSWEYAREEALQVVLRRIATYTDRTN